MKTTKLFFLGILGLTAFLGNAQWVLTGNFNATATSFIGTTAANPAIGQDINFKRAGVAAGLLNTIKTSFGVNSLSMPNSVSIGVSAGQYSSGFGYNTFIGQNAGKGTSTFFNSGANNVFIGYESATFNRTGSQNTFIGGYSGQNNIVGANNVYIGTYSGESTNGDGNSFVGANAGTDCLGTGNSFFGNLVGSDYIGNYNTFLGYYAGSSGSGNGNIFIGSNAGIIAPSTNDKLVIENSSSINPLIWGDFANDQLKFHGKVGIGGNTATAFGNFPSNSGGVSVSNYNLFVKGGILTDEVRVSTSWADYVFAKDYKLPTLQEVEKHIQEKGHLINIPSAQRVKEDGIELGEMAKIQQEKIEELTLYIIEQNKINEAQNKLILQLSDRLNAIEKR